MATVNTLCFLFLLLCHSIYISGTLATEEVLQQENGSKAQKLKVKSDDSLNIPGTTLSTTPITNPANFPYTATPTIVTVPASTPSSITPQMPLPTPITTVPTTTTPATTTPIFNPANPGPTAGTNPATQYPTPDTGGNTPAYVPPTVGTNPGYIPPTGGGGTNPGYMPPAVGTNPVTTPATAITPGQTWCIARAGSPESLLQSGLDYACGIGAADCSTIQEGASCYVPNTLEYHASYAFNSYFQKNPVATSCNFGGVATLVNTNPSVGSCIFPASAAQSAMPSSMNPPVTPVSTPSTTFPPATTSSSGATGAGIGTGPASTGVPYGFPGPSIDSPPSVFNTGNPAINSPGILGPDSPPNGAVPAGSAALQPFIAFIILVAALSTGKLIMGS